MISDGEKFKRNTTFPSIMGQDLVPHIKNAVVMRIEELGEHYAYFELTYLVLEGERTGSEHLPDMQLKFDGLDDTRISTCYLSRPIKRETGTNVSHTDKLLYEGRNLEDVTRVIDLSQKGKALFLGETPIHCTDKGVVDRLKFEDPQIRRALASVDFTRADRDYAINGDDALLERRIHGITLFEKGFKK